MPGHLGEDEPSRHDYVLAGRDEQHDFAVAQTKAEMAAAPGLLHRHETLRVGEAFQTSHIDDEVDDPVIRKPRRGRVTIGAGPRNLSQPVVAAFAKTRNWDELHAGAGRIWVAMADPHDRRHKGPVLDRADLERDRLAGTRAPGIAIADNGGLHGLQRHDYMASDTLVRGKHDA